jgi:gas vesicle protein
MALERYWDYAYSVSGQGNTRYHGPLEKQAAGGSGTMTSGHHYGILSSGWDEKAYYESATGYDHISMYDASQDATGTHHYGKSGGYDGRIKNATKDVIGYDPTIGANATLSRGKSYFTKWISEGEYKDQDTTGRTLQTYRADDVNKRRKEKYERVGGAVEVINFDQYMNDVGYAEAAQAMGISSYENLEQVHNAMAYMRGDYTPPAAEEPAPEVDNTLQTLDGTESAQGSGFIEPITGVNDNNTDIVQQLIDAGYIGGTQQFDYEAGYNDLMKQLGGLESGFSTQLSDALATQESGFATQLADALAVQDTAYQTELSNALATQADTYSTNLANALATQQGAFDTTLSSLNDQLDTYQTEIKNMQEEAIKAQESMAIQAAYGDPGRLVGPSVTGVKTKDSLEKEMGLTIKGATGTFGRAGLRIQSLNI